METNKSYRIRTKVDSSTEVAFVDVNLAQTYDTLEILSLKLDQKNSYKFYDSEVGIICGRVLANGNFGVPNAKVSVFIAAEDNQTVRERILYNFATVNDKNLDQVKYNLLPDFIDDACHQDVGTFPNKRLVLDNNDVLEVFDKYYKYTTRTNNSGDYMLYGIPVGMQQVHVDIDLSDIGVLSQKPRDMTDQGSPIDLFESPNKFKKSSTLESLVQIKSQDKGVYVYPFWGNSNNLEDTGDNTIAITRCDIDISYEFKPTAIFMGSIITDKGSNAIQKDCTGNEMVGRMSDMISGEGSIEMIRKTPDGRVEECSIKGTKVIDGNGVWCYQIPMNLDYVMTDEFGNMVPTDDPTKGIPTRTRVRFRISLDEMPSDLDTHKRCRYLVPNNPRYDEVDYPKFYHSKEADYSFGTSTREESYCDLFWNNVYTVKNYIPNLKKNHKYAERKHTGIKSVNFSGDNNPMPYNTMQIRLPFIYKQNCVLTKIVIYIVAFINTILTILTEPLCQTADALIKTGKALMKTIILYPVGLPLYGIGELFKLMIVSGITFSNEFCDDGINNRAYYPTLFKIAGWCVWKQHIVPKFASKQEEYMRENPEDWEGLSQIENVWGEHNKLMTCIENNLAQENDCVAFNFSNDWVNGVLYAPQWYRRIRKKRRVFFGIFGIPGRDEWCRSNASSNAKLTLNCALSKKMGNPTNLKSPIDDKPYNYPVSVVKKCDDRKKCHDDYSQIKLEGGIVETRETILGETVYYYKAIEFNNTVSKSHPDDDGVILLFATDIVLLGSLNDCDSNGLPQFFRYIQGTTYQIPSPILFTNTDIIVPPNGGTPRYEDISFETTTESTGCDWGNLNWIDECGKMGYDTDGGLFYGIGCSAFEVAAKSCINISRICEMGVEMDTTKSLPILSTLKDHPDSDNAYVKLVPDGFISADELSGNDERAMFATLNGNKLRTRNNKTNGMLEYDMFYLYPNNFDGLAEPLMRHRGCDNPDANYTTNFNLEYFSKDYYLFRMGFKPYYYDNEYRFPRYENSFYFYFGLKNGKTAIDRFHTLYFAPCEDDPEASSPIGIETKANDWCKNEDQIANGYVLLDLSNITAPYSIVINSIDNESLGWEEKDCNDEKKFLGIYSNLSLKDKDYVKRIFFENGKINDWNTVDEENEKVDYIPNGSYKITITDADGNIIEERFDLKPKPLTFTLQKFDNITDDNITRIGKGSYNDIFVGNINDLEKAGGYVVIDSIYNGDNTALCGDEGEKKGYYKIRISPHNIDDLSDFDEAFGEGTWEKCGIPKTTIVTVDERGDIKGFYDKSDFSKIFLYDEKEKKIYIQTPKGDVTYDIEVIQMCGCEEDDMVEGDNSQIVNVRINDTIPFKLYVNGFDVSAINFDGQVKGGNFATGFYENEKDKTPKTEPIGKQTIGEAWVQLTNDDKMDDYYNFTSVKEIQDAKKESNNEIKELKGYIEAYNDKIAHKEEYVKNLDTNYKNAQEATDENKHDIEKKSEELLKELNEIKTDVYKIYNESLINGTASDKIQKYYTCVNTLISYVNNYDEIDFNSEKIKDVFSDSDNPFKDIVCDIKIYNKMLSKYKEAKQEEDELYSEISEYLPYKDHLINALDKYIDNIENQDLKKRLNDIKEKINKWDKDISIDEEDLANNTPSLVNAREAFKEKIRDAFWVTCDTHTITISVQTNEQNKGVEYQLYYKPEVEDEDTFIHLLESSKYEGPLNENTVDSVGIPTLVIGDDKNYIEKDERGNITNQNQVAINANINKDNTTTTVYHSYPEIMDSTNRSYKGIYAVRVYSTDANKKEVKSLPEKGNGTIDKKEFFFFHLVDKRLSINYGTWSFPADIPYYNDNNNVKNQKFTINNILAGYVYNGSCENDKFKTSKLNDTLFDTVKHPNDLEYSMPTRRMITTDVNISEKKPFGNYALTENGEQKIGYYPYVPIPRTIKTGTIDISCNDGCSINENTNCGLINALIEEGVYYSEGYQQIESFNMQRNISSLSDNASEYTYYVVDNKVTTHPLMKDVSFEEGYYIQKNKEGDYSFMSFENVIDINKFRDLFNLKKDDNDNTNNTFHIRSVQIPKDEEMFTNPLLLSNIVDVLYNDESGQNKSIGINTQFYVVCVNDLNNRTISPLYDFTEAKFNTEIICDATIYRNECTSFSKHVEKVDINIKQGKEVYYLKWFDYYYDKITINVEDTTTNLNIDKVLATDYPIVSYNTLGITTIVDKIQKEMNNFLNNLRTDKPQITVAVPFVTDVTGLQLPVDTSEVDLKIRCNVIIDYSSSMGIESNLINQTKFNERFDTEGYAIETNKVSKYYLMGNNASGIKTDFEQCLNANHICCYKANGSMLDDTQLANVNEPLYIEPVTIRVNVKKQDGTAIDGLFLDTSFKPTDNVDLSPACIFKTTMLSNGTDIYYSNIKNFDFNTDKDYCIQNCKDSVEIEEVPIKVQVTRYSGVQNTISLNSEYKCDSNIPSSTTPIARKFYVKSPSFLTSMGGQDNINEFNFSEYATQLRNNNTYLIEIEER